MKFYVLKVDTYNLPKVKAELYMKHCGNMVKELFKEAGITAPVLVLPSNVDLFEFDVPDSERSAQKEPGKQLLTEDRLDRYRDMMDS